MALIKFESSMWIAIHSCASSEFTDFILYQLETKEDSRIRINPIL
jgi:hypothetical protein